MRPWSLQEGVEIGRDDGVVRNDHDLSTTETLELVGVSPCLMG